MTITNILIKKYIKLMILFYIVLIISSCIPTNNENINLIEVNVSKEYWDVGGIDIISIKENELVWNRVNIEEKLGSYCYKHDYIYLRQKVYSLNPLVVYCYNGGPILTNGEWIYLLTSKKRVIGHNEQYILISDFTLLNKLSGEVLTDNVTKKYPKTNYNKVYHSGAAAVSKNKRFFTFDIDNRTISEINSQGVKKKIIKLPITILGVTVVEEMVASDDGNYLFVITKESRRGTGDAFFHMIDVKSKSIIFEKYLGNMSIFQGFLQMFSDNIIISFLNPSSTKTAGNIITLRYEFNIKKVK